MDDFQTKLNILTDMLIKKKALLTQIETITENQEGILLSPFAAGEEGALFFNGLNDEKQKLIELVLEADRLFQKMFDDSKDEFDNRAGDFKDEIQALKDHIKEIVELDSRIRIREEKNKMLLEKTRPKKKIDTSGANKSHVLKQYEKNKNF